MADPKLGDKNIKKHLKKLAEEERKKRQILTNRESKAAERSEAIKKMAQPNERLKGFFQAIAIIHGNDYAKYCEQYYYQAQSDEGVFE